MVAVPPHNVLERIGQLREGHLSRHPHQPPHLGVGVGQRDPQRQRLAGHVGLAPPRRLLRLHVGDRTASVVHAIRRAVRRSSLHAVSCGLDVTAGGSGLRLLQGRDLAGVLATLCAFPGVLELAAVLFGPLGHHALCPRWQPAVRDPEILDAHRGLVAAVLGMEVGRPVIPEVHPDHDAVEAADLRHRQRPAAAGTAPLGSCR